MTTTISGSNGIVFPDATSMQTGQQAVKAWVNFNGDGVVAIRAGYNVSSITDNGVGQYTINFATNMVDANYCINGTAGENTNDLINVSQPFNTFPPSTSSVRVCTPYVNSTVFDSSTVSVSIFR